MNGADLVKLEVIDDQEFAQGSIGGSDGIICLDLGFTEQAAIAKADDLGDAAPYIKTNQDALVPGQFAFNTIGHSWRHPGRGIALT